MNANDNGLFDKPAEWSAELQHPKSWTDEYYDNLLKAWAPERCHQWTPHYEPLYMKEGAIQTSRHYEQSAINAQPFTQDYPMQHQPYLGIPNSNQNNMQSFFGLMMPETFAKEDFSANLWHDDRLPGGFSDRNRCAGSSHDENSSTSETVINSIENGPERTIQHSKRSAMNEINEYSGASRKRVRKTFPITAETTAESKAIHDRGKESSTRLYQKLFQNKHHAKESLETVMELHRKPVSNCSFPADDETFPKTDEEYRQRVHQVFDAICDWSYILEWRAVLPKGQKNRIIAEFLNDRPERHQHVSVDGPLADFTPTEAELASILPPVEDQQRRVLRQIPNDQTIEWISWGIVDAAIKSQQGHTQVPYWCVSEGG